MMHVVVHADRGILVLWSRLSYFGGTPRPMTSGPSGDAVSTSSERVPVLLTRGDVVIELDLGITESDMTGLHQRFKVSRPGVYCWGLWG